MKQRQSQSFCALSSEVPLGTMSQLSLRTQFWRSTGSHTRRSLPVAVRTSLPTNTEGAYGQRQCSSSYLPFTTIMVCTQSRANSPWNGLIAQSCAFAGSDELRKMYFASSTRSVENGRCRVLPCRHSLSRPGQSCIAQNSKRSLGLPWEHSETGYLDSKLSVTSIATSIPSLDHETKQCLYRRVQQLLRIASVGEITATARWTWNSIVEQSVLWSFHW